MSIFEENATILLLRNPHLGALWLIPLVKNLQLFSLRKAKVFLRRISFSLLFIIL